MSEILAVFGINYKLILIQIINFLILLLILYKILYKPLLRLLDEREQKIAKGVRDADEAKARLEQAEEQKQEITRQAKDQASATIAEAVETAKEREKKIVDEAHDKASHILDKAHKTGEEQKEQIIQSSREEIAKMITLGAEKVLAGAK